MTGDVSAFQLVLSGDPGLFAIVRLSLLVSLSAVLFAALLGVPFGALLALTRFRGREAVIVVLNALMGLPPVVAGLAIFLLLSRSGPLGSLGLLFTPQAMVIAQTVLVAPIIAALTRQTVEDLWAEYHDELAAMNVGAARRVTTLIWDARFSLVTALLAGFGRAAAEVGAIIIVGGNIEGFTRTMTTAIALETSKGDLPLAIGLGMVLIVIVIMINALAWGAAPGRRTLRRMSMRAPVSDLPFMFADARIVAGATAILDDVTLTIADGLPDRPDRTERQWQDNALARRDGPYSADRRPHHLGRTRAAAPARRAIMFQRPAMLRRSAAAMSATRSPPRMFRASSASPCRRIADTGRARRPGHRPARRLSGGEQQRLALARALARDPAVLFLDEPTASLDPHATKAIEDIIRAVSARGVKVVMSTHDLGQARRLAGDIVLLHRGRLIETATAEEFFARPRTQEARKFIAGELLV